MSNFDSNPIKGAEVNIVGMTNLFQAVMDNKIRKVFQVVRVFTGLHQKYW